jgi:polyhydroxyalkanoate synthesis regulator phasin
MNDGSILTNDALSESKKSGDRYNKDSYESGVDLLTSQKASDTQFGIDAAKTGYQVGKPLLSEAAKGATADVVKEWGKNSVQSGSQAAGQSLIGSTTTAGLLGQAAGLYGAYDAYNMYNDLEGAQAKLNFDPKMSALRGAADGAAIGTAILPGVGTAIGAAAGAAFGGFLKKLKTGKDEDQLKRDLIREALESKGFLDKEGKYTLGDGTVFEMGKDGGFKYADGFHAYEVDHSDKLQGTVFGHALPIAEMMTGSDDKLTSDFAGYLTRMALADGSKDVNKALENLKTAATKLGVDPEKTSKYIVSMVEKGAITPEEATAYVGGIGNVFSEKRNLTLLGDEATQTPATSSSSAQKAKDSSKTVANKVDRTTGSQKKKQVQSAVSSLAQAATQTFEEQVKNMADAWGASYQKAVNPGSVA